MNLKKDYVSPCVEVIEVVVEEGFAASEGDFGGSGNDFPWGN